MRIQVVVNSDLYSCLGCFGDVALERGILGSGTRAADGSSRSAEHCELNAGSLHLLPVDGSLGVGNVDALDTGVGGVLAGVFVVAGVGVYECSVGVAVVYQAAAL